MSETKWTRGPWRIEPDANVVWGECDPDDLTTRGYGIPVAELSMHKPRWASGKSELNWQANAHLIAAAPELYEALQRFVDQADAQMIDWNDPHDVANFTGWVMSGDSLLQARTLLSKARGEAQ